MPPGHEPVDPLDQAVARMGADPALLATLRGRLSSLSWLMRALAEPIARRAHCEDHCTGKRPPAMGLPTFGPVTSASCCYLDKRAESIS